MTHLDASAQRALATETALELPPIETLTPAQARANYLATFSAAQLPHEDVVSVFSEERDGIRLKVWRGHDAPQKNAAALLYLHGGGWVIGTPETHEDICRSLANRANAVVVSPNYRLGPENRFPTAVEDCALVLRYMHREADVLGISRSRIAVGGDSAGGNLAAVLALMARDGDVPPVAAQLLIYPATDFRQNSKSYSSCATGYGLTASGMDWFRGRYLSNAAETQEWRASPLLVGSVKGVAPAVVILAGHDVLYDEGSAYTARLRSEARVIEHVWPGQIHGFVSKRKLIPEGDEAIDRIVNGWMTFDDNDPVDS